jgi:hypothetical protein
VTVFIIVAAVGLAVLLLSLLVDGVGDTLDFAGTGSGIISGASIGGLISGIGFGGIFGRAVTDSFALVALISGLTGRAGAALAAFWYRWLQRAQGDEKELAISGIVGRTATVRSVSREDPATGAVAVTYLGAARTMQFLAGQELKAGQRVRVTELVDPETIRVEPAEN